MTGPAPNGALTFEDAIRLSGYQPTTFGDDGGYSALHRPGSWEWQLAPAKYARELLVRLGYVAIADADAPHRVHWHRNKSALAGPNAATLLPSAAAQVEALQHAHRIRGDLAVAGVAVPIAAATERTTTTSDTPARLFLGTVNAELHVVPCEACHGHPRCEDCATCLGQGRVAFTSDRRIVLLHLVWDGHR